MEEGGDGGGREWWKWEGRGVDPATHPRAVEVVKVFFFLSQWARKAERKERRGSETEENPCGYQMYQMLLVLLD